MQKFIRYFLIISATIFILLTAFVYLPIPGLAFDEHAGAALDFETRAATFFDLVDNSSSLLRPFPEMLTRSDNPGTDEKIELGKLLYFDPVLSGSNEVSCAHCHHPDLGFSDNRGLSMGKGGTGLGRDRSGGAVLRRGSPTIWNAAFNHRQFWDGRARDLEEQAGKPIVNAKEMAQDPAELVRELQTIPDYQERFQKAFPEAGEDAVSFQNTTYAIAAFERTLISQNSRFDRYAAGDVSALTKTERKGLNVFRSLKTRCFECHNFPTFANPDFKVIGVPDLPEQAEDMGRGEIDGNAYNRAFKVPTLRNIALTAPYMHNGVFQTLEAVIDFYADGGGSGIGMDLPNIDDKIRKFDISDSDKQALIAFLHTLTDESAKPEIPSEVPSGLPVVAELANQSPELASFEPPAVPQQNITLERKGRKIIVRPGDRIQDGLDLAVSGDTVLVLPGEYHETLTLDMPGITLLGQIENGKKPVLDGKEVISDGLVGSGSDFEIRNFIVKNFTANGLMLDGAKNIVFRDLDCDNTGLYGVYPVGCIGVTVERCTVTRVKDAGIYVGQSKDIVVRDCKAFANVTGIEIENSVNAIVENNDVTNNTGGVLVFLLPNNPSKVSRKCIVRNNRIIKNNHPNFGDPTAVVGKVPPGSGVMILGADEVEVTGNQIEGNQSFGIAMIHLDMLYGKGAKYDLDPVPENNWIYGNTFVNNGYEPAGIIKENGFDGRDILWDLSGNGNSWDEPEASKLPPTLPEKSWSDFRRRLNKRMWTVLMNISG